MILGGTGTGKIGGIIRRFREERHETLESMAKKCGLSPSYLSEIESGRKTPSIRAIDRIAGALGISPSALLARERDDAGISLGEKIHFAREERGLTLKELATAAGISVAYLGSIEKNGTKPSPETLERIANALKVSLSGLMEQDNLRIARKIREIREDIGVTRSQLASRAEVSPSLISQLENGRVHPSLETLERIAGALGVSPCFLILEDQEVGEILAAMSPAVRRTLAEPRVQKLLRLLADFSEEEFRFVLGFAQLYRQHRSPKAETDGEER